MSKFDKLVEAGKVFIKPVQKAGKALGDFAESVGDGIARVDSYLEDRLSPPSGKKEPRSGPAPRKATKPAPKKAPAQAATAQPRNTGAAHKPVSPPERVKPANQASAPKKAPSEAEKAAKQRNRILLQMRDAIHNTYYKEDGFRFFAVKFCRYTRLILPGETDTRAMWISAYNSCIEPILYQLGKLRKTLEALGAQMGQPPLTPSNQALLDAMIDFADRAGAEGLSSPEGWEAEDYRAALTRYGTDLQQLLNAYPALED